MTGAFTEFIGKHASIAWLDAPDSAVRQCQ